VSINNAWEVFVPGCVVEDWAGAGLAGTMLEQPVDRINMPHNPIKLKYLVFIRPPDCRCIETGQYGNSKQPFES